MVWESCQNNGMVRESPLIEVGAVGNFFGMEAGTVVLAA